MRALLRSALGAIACCAAGAALAAEAGKPLAAPPQRWLMPTLDARAIEARCGVDTRAHATAMHAMEKRGEPGAILAEWNRLSSSVQDFIGPVFLLANTATDAAIRARLRSDAQNGYDAGDRTIPEPKLYARVRGLRPADAIERQYRQDY